MQFIEEVQAFKTRFETPRRTIVIPDISEEALAYDSLDEAGQIELKNQFLKTYFFAVGEADRILVWNQTKHRIPGYVGPNTLMELTAAFVYVKPIYLLHSPQDERTRLEILGLRPVILDGNPSKIFD